jgi:hypothetical protein
MFKNVWICTCPSQYAVMAWCLIKHRDSFISTFEIPVFLDILLHYVQTLSWSLMRSSLSSVSPGNSRFPSSSCSGCIWFQSFDLNCYLCSSSTWIQNQWIFVRANGYRSKKPASINYRIFLGYWNSWLVTAILQIGICGQVSNYFFIPCGGLRLSLLDTLATNRPIVPALDDRWEWNTNWQGKPKYPEEICPSATLSTTNSIWPDLWSKPGRRCGKSATDRLSYDKDTKSQKVRSNDMWRALTSGTCFPLFSCVPLRFNCNT